MEKTFEKRIATRRELEEVLMRVRFEGNLALMTGQELKVLILNLGVPCENQSSGVKTA